MVREDSTQCALQSVSEQTGGHYIGLGPSKSALVILAIRRSNALWARCISINVTVHERQGCTKRSVPYDL